MSHDDPIFAALAKLPLEPVAPELTQRIRRDAHAQLARARLKASPLPLRRGWLDWVAALVAFGVAVVHTGWAVAFVSALYR